MSLYYFPKRGGRNYGKLPAKQAETQPWGLLCINLMGKYWITPNKGGRKYDMKDKKDKDVYSSPNTITDSAVGSIEIRSVTEARVDLIANQVESGWLTRFLLPIKVIWDRGKAFLAEFKYMMANDYRIPCYLTSTRNPKVNSIAERVYQSIGNIIRTFKIQ